MWAIPKLWDALGLMWLRTTSEDSEANLAHYYLPGYWGADVICSNLLEYLESSVTYCYFQGHLASCQMISDLPGDIPSPIKHYSCCYLEPLLCFGGTGFSGKVSELPVHFISLFYLTTCSPWSGMYDVTWPEIRTACSLREVFRYNPWWKQEKNWVVSQCSSVTVTTDVSCAPSVLLPHSSLHAEGCLLWMLVTLPEGIFTLLARGIGSTFTCKLA